LGRGKDVIWGERLGVNVQRRGTLEAGCWWKKVGALGSESRFMQAVSTSAFGQNRMFIFSW